MEVDPSAVRDAYVKQMDELCAFYKQGLTSVGIDYHLVNTRQPYDQALSAYLARRTRTRK
jgi:hypothetical protein